ncbi:UPF0758 domain-containing protein [Oecophyllibacter saccharovorans]|uniref:UPF0758 domain-containing protein n=1 Tax=Oecophyllibacter saccharovorans TaxID=2558360 RepID=UPI001166A14F|nr:UPF0758 domain-containing protein [Oecophyllibacter saccharovorans]TPW34682.1 DNA repair protein RadC [Oecophyllibacter saccharovorans]
MRRRVLEHGAASLADYELLEMLLFCGIPRRDTKPVAKKLLQKFGSLAGVFQASRRELTESGLNQRSAELLEFPQLGAKSLAASTGPVMPVLGDWQALVAYLEQHCQPGVFCRLLYLDNRNRLLEDRALVKTPQPLAGLLRQVAGQALVLQATALIVVLCAPRGTAVGLAQGVRGLTLALKPLSLIIHDAVLVDYVHKDRLAWMMSFSQENLL